MKLLVVAPYFYPKVGGLENYAWHISKGLKEKYGWEIVVICSNHEEKKYNEGTLEGIRIYRLPYWFKASNTPINFGWFIDIWKIMKKEKPDVVNAHTPVPFISDIAALVSYLQKTQFVLSYHNDLVKNNFLDIIFNLYYSTLGAVTFAISKSIITTSQYYAENSKYLKKYRNKLRIISPGVDINTYKPSKKQSDNNIVLFVGQLDKTHKHKGLEFLIKSMQQVITNKPEVRLYVVGKGDNIEEYKKQALNLGISKNIVFTGYLDEGNLIRAYQKCTVVALPSLTDSEGFGMTLIEAGACAKPVIGTKVGGIPFVINGIPHAFASIATNPNPSRSDGNTNNFDDFMIAIASACFGKKSKNSICLVRPNFSVKLINFLFSGPLPIIIAFNLVPCSFRYAIVLIRRSIFLCFKSRPAYTTSDFLEEALICSISSLLSPERIV